MPDDAMSTPTAPDDATSTPTAPDDAMSTITALAGRLVPLRTKDEVRASLETQVAYVIEVPAKHANTVKE